MNKVFLVGNLAADPTSRVTSNGMNVVNVTIATSDMRNKGETHFFPCVAWSNQANFIITYLKKGDAVAVDGRLTRRSYVSKEGKTVYITEIVIDNIKSVGRRNKTEDDDLVSINESFTNKVMTQDDVTSKYENKKVNHQDNQSELSWLNDIEEE